MTRLREALDRATASSADTAVAAAAPAPWQFDAHLSDSRPPEAPATPETAATAGAPPPAAVPPVEEIALTTRLQGQEKLVAVPGADVAVVEQFRRLAAALHHAQVQRGARTVMIASAVENEGKTLTATNLALTLSQSYQRRVLLIDADLRRPSVHSIFKIDNSYGLSDTLKHVVPDGKLPLHRISPTLWIVPGGRPDPDPMSGLVSETMQQLLSEAVEQFDWVVIDTPPVALLPDANLLAAMIDTALLVVRANRTPYPMSMRAVDAIGPDRILGVVLNRAEEPDYDGGYYYSRYRYSYSHARGKNAPPSGWRRLFSRARNT